MSKHTPGPWWSHTNGSDFFVTATDFHGANGKVAKCYVADVQKFRNESGEDECQANAQLIAAAPDMLEALKVALLALGDEPHSDFPLCTSDDCTACMVKGAIALAEPGYFAKAQGTTE